MMGVGKKIKSFRDILGWLNTEKGDIEEFLGNVIYLEFWDHTNLSSIMALSFTKRLWEKYAEHGLQVIGVHSPEYEFERYMGNLEEAVERYNIEYPVAQDNNNSTWLLYGNRYVPRQFVVDKEGVILHENIGQGNEANLEKTIRDALGKDDEEYGRPLWEKGKREPILLDVSPETYLGSKDIMSVKKYPSYQLANEVVYNDPGEHEMNKVYLNGRWKQFDEFIENDGNSEEYLLYRFYARNVFVVASSYKNNARFDVYLNGGLVARNFGGKDILWDGDGTSYVQVDFSGLYGLIGGSEFIEGELKIVPKDVGLQLYVISFT